MKIKDVFPKWIVREKSYGELELGGSAFAHLSEDPGSAGDFIPPAIFSDTNVVFAVDPHALYYENSGAGIMFTPDKGSVFAQMAQDIDHWLDVRVAGETYDRFEIHGDGSIHWGNGNAAPDAFLAVDTDNNGFAFRGGYDVFVGDPADPDVKFKTGGPSVFKYGVSVRDTINGATYPNWLAGADGTFYWSDGAGLPDTSLSRLAAGVLGVGQDGGAIQLKSPNGTAYNITVANGGAVTSTPA